MGFGYCLSRWLWLSDLVRPLCLSRWASDTFRLMLMVVGHYCHCLLSLSNSGRFAWRFDLIDSYGNDFGHCPLRCPNHSNWHEWWMKLRSPSLFGFEHCLLRVPWRSVTVRSLSCVGRCPNVLLCLSWCACESVEANLVPSETLNPGRQTPSTAVIPGLECCPRLPHESADTLTSDNSTIPTGISVRVRSGD